MDIVQAFYDDLAVEYDKLFQDWQATTREQADILSGIFSGEGFDRSARILDCACGIGTQAIGLAALGYDVTGSDFSEGALAEARKRADANRVQIPFHRADFRCLSQVFSQKFHIVIAMDNALPHMLTSQALAQAIGSITAQLTEGGLFVASIRDYDSLLKTKPAYAPPYIHKTESGQRVCFQTWDWEGDNYRLTQYILEDGASLETSKFTCQYRATRRDEITQLLKANGCCQVRWVFPEETGFYQPILIARR